MLAEASMANSMRAFPSASQRGRTRRGYTDQSLGLGGAHVGTLVESRMRTCRRSTVGSMGDGRSRTARAPPPPVPRDQARAAAASQRAACRIDSIAFSSPRGSWPGTPAASGRHPSWQSSVRSPARTTANVGRRRISESSSANTSSAVRPWQSCPRSDWPVIAPSGRRTVGSGLVQTLANGSVTRP